MATVVDHYYVEDAEGRIYTVLGYTHPPGGFFAYLKYRPLSAGLKSPWCRGETCFERVVRQYSVRELLSGAQNLVWDPVFGVEIPFLPAFKVRRIYDPRERMREIISSPGDALEERLIAVAAAFADISGVPLDRFGVTGSILVGIHGPHSDIDVTVHGCREAVEVVEALRSTGLPGALPVEELKRWVSLQAELHGVRVEEAAKLYRSWRRGVVEGHTFSLIPIDESRAERYGKQVYLPEGKILVEAEVEQGSCEALLYPAQVRVYNYQVLEGSRPPLRVGTVLSYEGVFAPILYEYGRIRVLGELLCSPDECIVLVGSRRLRSWVMPVEA